MLMELYYKLSKDKSFFIEKINSDIEEALSLSIDPDFDDIQDFLKIVDFPVNILEAPYKHMSKFLDLSHEETLRSIPSEKLNKALQNISKVIQDVLGDKENELYLITYMNIKRFLRKLSRPTVSIDKLSKIKSSIDHDPTANRLKALEPDKFGKAAKITYEMAATATGRLTVSSGPNILTLPAISRKSFVSSFSKGKILQVDLTAAEPRIALLYSNIKSPPDIYTHIASTILEEKVSRKEAKLITLCALYGQSPKKLAKALPDSINARDVIRKTKKFFNFDSLISDLSFKNKSNNFRNILGRPLKVDLDRSDLLISYFLQSSAAELSILMFSEFCELHKAKIKPIYVVHDALLFDCDYELSRALLEKRNITLNLGKWQFDAKVSDINS